MPGGRVEPGETPAQAAVRELEEETGFVVKESDLKPFFIDNCLGHDALAYRVDSRDFLFKVPSPRDGEGRAGWVPYSCILQGTFKDYNARLLDVILLTAVRGGL